MGIQTEILNISKQTVKKSTEHAAESANTELARQMKKVCSVDITDTVELSKLSKQVNTEETNLKGILIDLADKYLPGFSKKPPILSEGLTEDSLVLVRMTDYKPENGVIQSARDATRDSNGVGGSRSSLHFTLNHPVANNDLGLASDKMNYGIIMPFDQTIKLNGANKFIGGNPTDLFTRGSVKIPDGSVIVKPNSNIPEGKLRILNPDEIEDFKTVKSIKIVETSDNVHSITNRVIEMMGYTNKAANTPFGWGLINSEKDINIIVDNVNQWRKFVSRKQIKDFIHLYEPSARAEHIVEEIELLTQENSWKVIKNDKELINYKEELLKVISEINQATKKDYDLSFDVNKLAKIIEESATPKEAVQDIAKELKIRPLSNLTEIQNNKGGRKLSPAEIYTTIDLILGISNKAKIMHSEGIRFFEKSQISSEDLINFHNLSLDFVQNLANNPIVKELNA